MSEERDVKRVREAVRKVMWSRRVYANSADRRAILRAVVEACGFGWVQVDDLRFTDGMDDIAEGLSLLLRAAGIQEGGARR